MPMPNPSWDRLLSHFAYSHLPADLQEISKQFYALAHAMASALEATNDPAEVTVGLRKLLEAKDACVRAARGRAASA